MKLVLKPGFFGGVAAVVDAEDEAVGGGVSLSADGLAMTNPLPPPPEAPPVGWGKTGVTLGGEGVIERDEVVMSSLINTKMIQ